MKDPLTTYGGQAVMEGVMMRGAKSVAIAMRAPDNEIVIHTESLGQLYRSSITKIPFLRGLIMLWDSLGLGMRALTISANVQTGEDEKIEGPALYITLTISILFAVVLFFLIPAAGGHAAEMVLSNLFSTQTNPAQWMTWTGNLVEGIFRLLLLILYIASVRKIPEIRRVFMYHGAEHKTINAFEDDAELTPEIVSRYPIEHPRCGTSFLLTLVLLSILIFSILGPMPIMVRLGSRILLIPVLAGLAYEYIRWTARHLNSPFVRWIIRPNLALQHMTTIEPTTDMLEISIAAFKSMRSGEDPVT